MSDVDTPTSDAVVQDAVNPPDPVQDAINEVQPPGTVLYPETDVVRAALSGVPAGNSDELPEGTDAVKAAMTESMFPTGDEVTPSSQGELPQVSKTSSKEVADEE